MGEMQHRTKVSTTNGQHPTQGRDEAASLSAVKFSCLLAAPASSRNHHRGIFHGLRYTTRACCANTQQTVKELVDNAIDACRWRSSEQDAPTVRVVLRRLSTTRKAGGDGVAVGKELDKDDGACVSCSYKCPMFFTWSNVIAEQPSISI